MRRKTREISQRCSMNKSEIEKVRFDVVCDEGSALMMLLDKQGSISRQGTGALPIIDFLVTSESNGEVFNKLIDIIDERAFEYSGVYELAEKKGIPLTLSIAFLDTQEQPHFFEFRFGSDNEDVGELLPYFDKYVSQALALTDQWYLTEYEKHLKSEQAEKS